MDFIGIIPSRYASTRFPGKPLAKISGKPMIQWVYENSSKALEEVYVATDDERIFNEVEAFGGNVVMTSGEHQSGTERCREALGIISTGTESDPDVIINIQGDEPFIDPGQIELLKRCFDDPETQIATLVKAIDNKDDVFNPNKPKVVISEDRFALYFSRSPIPYLRGEDENNWHNLHTYYRHIGMYAYTQDALNKVTKLESTSLESAESLEQLRWLSHGLRIKVEFTDYDSPGVDTPEDLNQILKRM